MKTIAEIRRDNLVLLTIEFGSQDKVAELAETSPVYLSQIRNEAPDAKTGKLRQMGDPMARKIEKGCFKEVGWMDHSHEDASQSTQSPAGVVDLRRKLTLAQLLEGLSDYLVEMDMDDRRSAVRQIAELADTPQRHAKIAASITAMAPPAAFQVEKRKKG